jgi:hypothetical protein
MLRRKITNFLGLPELKLTKQVLQHKNVMTLHFKNGRLQSQSKVDSKISIRF